MVNSTKTAWYTPGGLSSARAPIWLRFNTVNCCTEFMVWNGVFFWEILGGGFFLDSWKWFRLTFAGIAQQTGMASGKVHKTRHSALIYKVSHGILKRGLDAPVTGETGQWVHRTGSIFVGLAWNFGKNSNWRLILRCIDSIKPQRGTINQSARQWTSAFFFWIQEKKFEIGMETLNHSTVA